MTPVQPHRPATRAWPVCGLASQTLSALALACLLAAGLAGPQRLHAQPNPMTLQELTERAKQAEDRANRLDQQLRAARGRADKAEAATKRLEEERQALQDEAEALRGEVKRLKTQLAEALLPPTTARPAAPQAAVMPATAMPASALQAVSPFRRMEALLQVAGCDECGQMAVLKAGVFDMGSPPGEPGREALYKGSESPLRVGVRVGRFEMGRTEVTQGQWKAVMGGENPSRFKECGDACPVENVSWDQIVGRDGFLERLNRQLGLSGAGAYRLPTEAEWEYAARAGTKTAFWWGSRITPAQANYHGDYEYEGGGSKGEYRGKTVKANSFEANGWGLYNVHGNVREWVQDGWHDSYVGAPAEGGEWVAGANTSRRVVRGGSWNYDPRDLRSAFRVRFEPDYRDDVLGFRLARTY